MKNTETLGRLFKQIHDGFVTDANKQLKSYDLTFSQMRILSYLDDNRESEITAKDLELFLDITHPTVSGLLQRLEKKGFISLAINPLDHRSKYISITDKAVVVKEQMNVYRRSIEHRLVEGLDPEETASLRRFLQVVLHNLNKRE